MKYVLLLFCFFSLLSCELEDLSESSSPESSDVVTKLVLGCQDSGWMNSELYALDYNYKKAYLLKGSRLPKGRISFETKNLDKDNLLFICYPDKGDSYSGIIHLSKDEFWSSHKGDPMSYYTVFNYKASYLTDIYKSVYIRLMENGYSHQEAKEISNNSVKEIFPSYPGEYIGSEKGASWSTYNNSTGNYYDYPGNQFIFMSNYKGVGISTISEQIANKISSNEGFDNYVSANFFDDLTIISESPKFENESDWVKFNYINASSTGESWFNHDDNGEKYLNMKLISSRKKNEEPSVLSFYQEVDVSKHLDKDIYFILEPEYIRGLNEKNAIGLYGCSGIGAILLEYMDSSGKEIGVSVMANMQDSIYLGSLFFNTTRTLEGNDYRRVIKIGQYRSRRVILDLSHEISRINNINSIQDVNSIRMSLLASDFYTDGYYFAFGSVIAPSCNRAEASLKVKKAGLYYK